MHEKAQQHTNSNIIIIGIREHDSEYYFRYANVQWIKAIFTKLISICGYYQ